MRRLLLGLLCLATTGSALAAPSIATPSGSTAASAVAGISSPPAPTPALSLDWPAPTYSPPTPSPQPPPQPTPVPVQTAQDAKAWAQRNLTPDEYTALYWIVWSESKWDPAAVNRSSGACGLGQFWPCSKMADSLPNWPTEPIAQLRDYVIPYARHKYGSIEGAWAFWASRGWW